MMHFRFEWILLIEFFFSIAAGQSRKGSVSPFTGSPSSHCRTASFQEWRLGTLCVEIIPVPRTIVSRRCWLCCCGADCSSSAVSPSSTTLISSARCLWIRILSPSVLSFSSCTCCLGLLRIDWIRALTESMFLPCTSRILCSSRLKKSNSLAIILRVV